MREREAFLELNDQNAKTWKRTVESDERKKTKTTNKIEIRLSGNEFAKERSESNAMRKERSKKKTTTKNGKFINSCHLQLREEKYKQKKIAHTQQNF